MSGLALVARKEVLEQVRTMRLMVVLAVFASLGLISPVLARYIREIVQAVGGDQFQGVIPTPTMADAIAQFTKNVGEFGVFLAVLVTMGAVATERDRGTAAFVVTKPISRRAFVTAKVVSIGALLAAGTAVAGILCWIYTTLLFQAPPLAGYAGAVALVWLSLAVVASITFLASVVARSAMAAGGIGLATMLVAGTLGAIPVIGPYMPLSLWAAANELAQGSMPANLAGPVIVNGIFVGAMVAVAAWVFGREEL